MATELLKGLNKLNVKINSPIDVYARGGTVVIEFPEMVKIKTYLSNGSQQDVRPDLLRTNNTGGVINVEFRSLKKIAWMEKRLMENSFTSFWP